jgi:serine/threonine-protein kinase
MIPVDSPDGSGGASDPLVGQTLAERYRITRKIGEGGMGAVYEATHVALGKRVAVKILREKFVDQPAIGQRLVQEARHASSIHNEHIIDITDSGVTGDGRTYLVMEHLDGESLAQRIRRDGPIPEARLLAIARQAALALGAAHAVGIIHRDVKPENLFLVARPAGEPDYVKVVDFGISKMMRPDEAPDALRLTRTGMVLGTPLYMSPEQARGEEELDHRIDIYALGVILYEGLTGEVPFSASNYLGIIAQVSAHAPPPPRALRPELSISPAVEALVLRAMAKSRDERYPTMEALIEDLDRVRAGGAPRPAGPAAGPRRRWPSVFPLFAAGSILAAGVAYAVLATGRGAPGGAGNPAAAVVPPRAAPAAPLSPQVVIHVETTPEGAEVRQGDRVFGVTPRDLLLPRSGAPARLSFHLDGYEEARTEVVPSADDSLRVRLLPRPARRHPHSPARPAEPAPASGGRPAVETLPNPY